MRENELIRIEPRWSTKVQIWIGAFFVFASVGTFLLFFLSDVKDARAVVVSSFVFVASSLLALYNYYRLNQTVTVFDSSIVFTREFVGREYDVRKYLLTDLESVSTNFAYVKLGIFTKMGSEYLSDAVVFVKGWERVKNIPLSAEEERDRPMRVAFRRLEKYLNERISSQKPSDSAPPPK